MAFSVLMGYGTTFAQKIPQSQVPSLVINQFSKTFPKASDIEWKIKDDKYKVEFETGWSKDHEAWFDQSGKLLAHQEEISKRAIPQAVQHTIKKDYHGYRIDDVKKITSGSVIQYQIELKSLTQEWKLRFDENGNLLQQNPD